MKENISFDSDWICKNLGIVAWISEVLPEFREDNPFTFNAEDTKTTVIWHK